MRFQRLIGVSGLALAAFFLLVLPKVAAADGPCPTSTLPFPTYYPITSAGLICDANGNLNVNVKLGGGSSSVTILGGTNGATPVPVSIATTLPIAPPTTVWLSEGLTVTSGSAYSSGNEVGQLITLTLPTGYLSGILEGIQVNVKSSQSNAYKLYLFTANPSNSTWSDKTTPAANVADRFLAIGPFNVAVYDNGLGTGTYYTLSGIASPFVSATSTLYAVLVTTAAVTFTSTTDVQISLGILPG